MVKDKQTPMTREELEVLIAGCNERQNQLLADFPAKRERLIAEFDATTNNLIGQAEGEKLVYQRLLDALPKVEDPPKDGGSVQPKPENVENMPTNGEGKSDA